MATENFKEVMKVLVEDYIEYSKHLNNMKIEGLKEASWKLSFKEYSELYLDYLNIVSNDIDDSIYREEPDLDETKEEEESTY